MVLQFTAMFGLKRSVAYLHCVLQHGLVDFLTRLHQP